MCIVNKISVHSSTCEAGRFNCESMTGDDTCVDEMVCPNNLTYLRHSLVCQRRCETLFEFCGVNKSFTGCGCMDAYVMSQDVSTYQVAFHEHLTQKEELLVNCLLLNQINSILGI